MNRPCPVSKERSGPEGEAGLLSTISHGSDLSRWHDVTRKSCEIDVCQAHPLACASWNSDFEGVPETYFQNSLPVPLITNPCCCC